MEDREKEKASFIIPTLNEESSIRKTIRTGFNCELIDEVIVVDGKSEDKTYQIAENEGARVITQPNDGKGEAIRIGLKIAKNPISVLMDADILNIKTEMIRKLIDTVRDGADFVIGDFDREGGRVTELTAKPLFRKFFPEIKVNQPLTGEFAGKTELLKNVPLRDGWGAQVDLLIPNWLDKNIDSRETYIGYKDHDRKDLFELTDMAKGVGIAILEHAWRLGRIENIGSKITRLQKAEEEEVEESISREATESLEQSKASEESE